MAAIRPPFTRETAQEKVKFAQNMWNTRNPEQVSKGYTADCVWRNRDAFFRGTNKIIEFLTEKWAKEKNYRLRKELFAFTDNKIAVQFWYEYQDSHDGMKWKRCYGLEDWTFDYETGKMKKRQMSANDIVLGRNGDGVAVPESGIEGRWYLDGVDVDDPSVTEKLTDAHF
ncbi:hypothetical protein HRR83_006121 [Exophiala dermatitidis]|uniref:DUF1348-domain-containing protein n=2 Tax=Exophiala dermatitidis TaxID=5970 RepID=H6BML1_EXODN|nr:uncharacterized protein HMPREF1120_01240 [Exophiala dermatitidis NIH/UT8656]KAJ4515053.1 hypothetical protein HRR74_005518 [Exophiala dermatitidis]EHY53039.1 hypothetical protein HMPREF1120_01240 [Exophiala dermatitidis NIH/UT8656]KAJ4517544.1 hypothetical protein HRR73_004596 [Exophiala dermatitidis]KAJ4548697.1 hypothetical protein HRR76_001284 [Exophiala dermatitidis]KAJ4552585.1 hypothetical protein HRR77_002587 [Exophiala dermatitidis]